MFFHCQTGLLELDFLKEVDDVNQLYERSSISRAIYRYEKFWLPLLAEISSSPETDLTWCPPLDIQWVWHTHMLAPVQYSQDCQAIVGRLVGHRLATAQERAAARYVRQTERQNNPDNYLLQANN